MIENDDQLEYYGADEDDSGNIPFVYNWQQL